MEGKFRLAEEPETQDLGNGTLRWMCHPASTGARQLTVVEGTRGGSVCLNTSRGVSKWLGRPFQAAAGIGVGTVVYA